MPIYIGQSKSKLYIGATKVKKAYLGSALVYSSGNTVTYHVDSGVTYQEEVGEGESCLSPKTFTPQKSGWTFVGWRSDATTNPDCYTSYNMGDSPVTLYAVFSQAATVTYYNGSSVASSQTKNRYYNNGNVSDPQFVLTQTALSGWAARGWSTSTAANGAITYANGATFTRSSSIILYGMYYQTISVGYAGNGATSGSVAGQSGSRYYNPGSGAVANPTFTLQANGFAKTNYTFTKWALGSAGGTQYAAGASVTLAASTTFYAVWQGVAFAWISNYVAASGQTLTLTLQTSDGAKTLHRAEFQPTYYEDKNMYFEGTTNAVQSRGLRNMSVTFRIYPGTAADQIGGCKFAVYAGGSVVYEKKEQDPDKTVSVSLPAADVPVYIYVKGYSWGYTNPPWFHIRSVSFS